MTDWIREKRKELGMSQAQLAKASGVSRQMISYIENGHISDIRISTLLKLESILVPKESVKKNIARRKRIMQLTKFVIVKHIQDSGKYLFKVPKNVTLEAGDKIVCNTSRGNDQLGVCCCDSFLADAEMMCGLFGTQISKLRYVTGRVEYDKFDPEEDDDDGEDGQQDGRREI